MITDRGEGRIEARLIRDRVGEAESERFKRTAGSQDEEGDKQLDPLQ